MVRLATQPYTTRNRKSKFAHLTNFSVNKKATNYKKAGSVELDETETSKWQLKTLKIVMEQQGIDFSGIWESIKDLVIKTVISVEPMLANNLNRASRNRHLCFEVYGFDVILDNNLKPWLLEVNVLPSLSSSSKLDKKVKTALMADVFSVIGVTPYNKKKLERMQESTKWQRFSGMYKEHRHNTRGDNTKGDTTKGDTTKGDTTKGEREVNSNGFTSFTDFGNKVHIQDHQESGQNQTIMQSLDNSQL